MALFGKPYKTESGENWQESEVFTRTLHWITSDLNKNYKELAEFLGIPEELLIADSVTVTIQAERNLDNPNSPLQQPEFAELKNRPLEESRISKLTSLLEKLSGKKVMLQKKD